MPTKLVVDITAGTEEYVEMTAEEIAQREADSAARQAVMEAEEAAAAKRAADTASGVRLFNSSVVTFVVSDVPSILKVVCVCSLILYPFYEAFKP